MSKTRGRPKGARKLRTLMHDLANEPVVINDADGDRQVPMYMALLRKLQYLAMAGDIEADKALDRFRPRVDPEPTSKPGLLVVPQTLSQEEWIRRAKIENGLRSEPTMMAPPTSPPASSAPVRRQPPLAFQSGTSRRPRLMR